MNEEDSEKQSGPWTRAKKRVEDFVAEWAEKHGIDPKKILFKWDVHQGLVLPEHEIEINQTVCILTVYMGKKSQALSFSGPSFSRSNENPERFLSEHKDEVIAVLRKLKRPEKPGTMQRPK
jgi:hypothetical protein